MPIKIEYDAPFSLVAGYAAGQNKADERNQKRADQLLEHQLDRREREQTRLLAHEWDVEHQNAAFGQQERMQQRAFEQQGAIQGAAFQQQGAINEADFQQRQQLLVERERNEEQRWINEGMRLGEYVPADANRLSSLFDARSRAYSDPRLDANQRSQVVSQLNAQISEVGRRRMKPKQLSPEEDFQQNTITVEGKRYSRTAKGWTVIDDPEKIKPEKPTASDLSQPANLQRARDQAERAMWHRKKAKADADGDDTPFDVTPDEVDAELRRHGYKLPQQGSADAGGAGSGEQLPTFNTPADVKASGLAPGSRFKTPDGQIRVVPQPQAAPAAGPNPPPAAPPLEQAAAMPEAQPVAEQRPAPVPDGRVGLSPAEQVSFKADAQLLDKELRGSGATGDANDKQWITRQKTIVQTRMKRILAGRSPNRLSAEELAEYRNLYAQNIRLMNSLAAMEN